MSESSAFPVRSPAVGGLSPSAASTRDRRLAALAPSKLGSSAAIWSWFVVMLGILSVIKLLLVAGQAQGLYESHWRIDGTSLNWLSFAAFYAFLLLGGLALLRLDRECQQTSVLTVRVANAVVLLLGLAFIFLTFHNGNRNYLYPILSGVLKWTSLIPYLANSFFFNQPFLGAWFFVYAALYYFMARTGRERWVLLLTGAFAMAYSVIYLQEFAYRRNELLVADIVGAVSLWTAWRRSRSGVPSIRLSPLWLALPAGWTLFFGWALLRFDDQWRSNAAIYFIGLLVGTLVLFAGAAWVMRRAGNPPVWSWLCPFFVTAFFLFANSNYPTSLNYNHLVILALSFPRYFLGDFTMLAAIVGCAFLYRQWRTGASLWWLHPAGLALLLVTAVDLRLTQIMGVRLGWDVLSFGDSPKMMLRMARPYLPGVLLGLTALVLCYGLVLRAGRTWLSKNYFKHAIADAPEKTLTPLNVPTASAAGMTYLATLALALGGLGLLIADSDKASGQSMVRLVRTSPLWKRVSSHTMSSQEFMRAAKELGLGSFAVPSLPTQPPRDLNVLVVFMESSYNKHLSLFGSSEETQPLLAQYKDRMELFPNFFSAFTGSIHARFATFTSLYPSLDFHSFTQEHVPVKSLFEVFHDQGYTCSMFYSSYFDYTGFRDFLKNRGLDEMYDADTMPGQHGSERVAWGLQEEETLGAIRGQLQKYAQKRQRFCLTYVPAAPHYPYDKIPKAFRKHKMEEMGDFTPVYLNELLYMDWVITSILDELKQTGLLDKTLVIITNDHGEMLGGKDGHLGHGWAVTPDLANTPLILMDPERQGFRINKTVGTQVDLLPTLLDRLHIPVPPNQLYEGISLDAGATGSTRFGYLNSNKEFGIISGDQILLGDRESNVPTGTTSSGAMFTIVNEGVKTIFVNDSMRQTNGAFLSFQARKALIGRFDSFQENLLRNYAQYAKSIRGDKQIAQAR